MKDEKTVDSTKTVSPFNEKNFPFTIEINFNPDMEKKTVDVDVNYHGDPSLNNVAVVFDHAINLFKQAVINVGEINGFAVNSPEFLNMTSTKTVSEIGKMRDMQKAKKPSVDGVEEPIKAKMNIVTGDEGDANLTTK